MPGQLEINRKKLDEMEANIDEEIAALERHTQAITPKDLLLLIKAMRILEKAKSKASVDAVSAAILLP